MHLSKKLRHKQYSKIKLIFTHGILVKSLKGISAMICIRKNPNLKIHSHAFTLLSYLLMVPRRRKPASLGGAASARTATSLSKRGSIVALILLTLWVSVADSRDAFLFTAGARLSTGVPGAECFSGIAGTLVLLRI